MKHPFPENGLSYFLLYLISRAGAGAVSAERAAGTSSELSSKKMDKAKKLAGAKHRKRKREKEMACQLMRQQLNKWMKGNR